MHVLKRAELVSYKGEKKYNHTSKTNHITQYGKHYLSTAVSFKDNAFNIAKVSLYIFK